MRNWSISRPGLCRPGAAPSRPWTLWPRIFRKITLATPCARAAFKIWASFSRKTRKGFCEHYAPASPICCDSGGHPFPRCRRLSAAANGILGRSRSLVRDSDAHAWVEAWDGPSREWSRKFDPTNYVAPDPPPAWSANSTPSTWPWYRVATAFVTAFFTSIGDRIEELYITAIALRAVGIPAARLFVGLLLFLTAWLARRDRPAPSSGRPRGTLQPACWRNWTNVPTAGNDLAKRRSPGWPACNTVLPRREGKRSERFAAAYSAGVYSKSVIAILR